MLHSTEVVGMNDYQMAPVPIVLSDLEGQFSCFKACNLSTAIPQEMLHLLTGSIARSAKRRLFMVALCNRADHIYFHAVVCSSSSSFFFFLA